MIARAAPLQGVGSIRSSAWRAGAPGLVLRPTGRFVTRTRRGGESDSEPSSIGSSVSSDSNHKKTKYARSTKPGGWWSLNPVIHRLLGKRQPGATDKSTRSVIPLAAFSLALAGARSGAGLPVAPGQGPVPDRGITRHAAETQQIPDEPGIRCMRAWLDSPEGPLYLARA